MAAGAGGVCVTSCGRVRTRAWTITTAETTSAVALAERRLAEFGEGVLYAGFTAETEG